MCCFVYMNIDLIYTLKLCIVVGYKYDHRSRLVCRRCEVS